MRDRGRHPPNIIVVAFYALGMGKGITLFAVASFTQVTDVSGLMVAFLIFVTSIYKALFCYRNYFDATIILYIYPIHLHYSRPYGDFFLVRHADIIAPPPKKKNSSTDLY